MPNTYIKQGLKITNELADNSTISFEIPSGRIDVRIDEENECLYIYALAKHSEKVFIQPISANTFQLHLKEYHNK